MSEELLYYQNKNKGIARKTIPIERHYSQPRAEAPSTAASEPLSVEMRSLALILKILSTCSSYARRSGSIKYSPALARPPKNTKASGVLKVAKSAQVRPRS